MDVQAHQKHLDGLRRRAENIDGEWVRGVIEGMWSCRQQYMFAVDKAGKATSFHSSYSALAGLIPDFDDEVSKMYGSNSVYLPE